MLPQVIWYHGSMTRTNADVLLGFIVAMNDAGYEVSAIHDYQAHMIAEAPMTRREVIDVLSSSCAECHVTFDRISDDDNLPPRVVVTMDAWGDPISGWSVHEGYGDPVRQAFHDTIGDDASPCHVELL